jgi:hypothetical protein
MVATLDIDITPAITEQGFSEEGTFISLAAETYVAGTVLGRVTASNKWTPYVAGASDGSEVPKAILMADVVATGAAQDIPLFVMISGRTKSSLTIAHGVGPVTLAEADALRSYGIIVQPVTELNIYDNS